jgi:peroxiredoxin Q/BCP
MAKKAAKKAAKKVTPKAPKKATKKATKKVAKPAPTKAPKKTTTKTPAATASVSPALPAVGSPAPAFKLASSAGRDISLADYKGKTVVLYFYPKADTPGCTVQACGFRDAIASYGKLSVDVLGVSPDPVKDVTKFASKFDLNFPLLADTDHKVCQAYGVWVQKSMYGKTYMGTARTTFVIKDGKIAHVFEKVKPDGHEAEVLNVLKVLKVPG